MEFVSVMETELEELVALTSPEKSLALFPAVTLPVVVTEKVSSVTAPENVVDPVPADWVNSFAVTVLENTVLAAFVIVISPVPRSPTAPVTVISPDAPALNRTDSSSALFNVELNVMSSFA